MKMEFNQFIQEEMKDQDFAREYYRKATYFRLADELILLRKKRGLTQNELAEKAGTTQAVVSRLENVSVHASLESVVKLAEALDSVVEVRLVPMEDLEGRNRQGSETQEQDCFEIIKEKYHFDHHSEFSWDPSGLGGTISWGLAQKPTLQAVKRSRKFPELA